MQKYDLEPWQVQVEVQMVLNDTTAKLVKRASENELLAADTIILPTTLNSSETEAIVQVSAPQEVVRLVHCSSIYIIVIVMVSCCIGS